MEYPSTERMRSLAATASSAPVDVRHTHRNWLSRWAEILDADPERMVWLYRKFEGIPARIQGQIPAQCTALTLAACDPQLRKDGLTGDRPRTAAQFFGLTDEQLHHIVCYCAYGHETAVPAALITKRVREAADLAL